MTLDDVAYVLGGRIEVNHTRSTPREVCVALRGCLIKNGELVSSCVGFGRTEGSARRRLAKQLSNQWVYGSRSKDVTIPLPKVTP